jgi:hypothetical protein
VTHPLAHSLTHSLTHSQVWKKASENRGNPKNEDDDDVENYVVQVRLVAYQITRYSCKGSICP